MNINFKYCFVTIILIVFWSFAGYTQYIGKPFVINYTRDIYQGQSQNWSIDRSESGLIYIGNNKGLIQFDGSNWRLFSMPDELLVRSVAIADDNTVYVGTYEEFGYFSYNHKGEFFYTSLTKDLEPGFFHNDEIWRIIPHEDKVYFQSFSSIFVYENGKIRRIDPEGTIVLLMKTSDRIFVHKVNSGVFELIDDELVMLEGTEMLAKDEVKAFLKLDQNKYIIGSYSQGLFLYENGKISKWEIPSADIIRNAEINNALILKDYIIIGTIVDGVFILDKNGNLIDHLNTDNFLQNNTVLALCPDGDNHFWAGLDRGIEYISLNNALDLYINPSGSSSTVYDAVFRDELLYVATNQGVYTYDYDKISGFSNPILIDGTQGQVWDLCVFDNELFCGHNDGTFRIKGKNIEQISGINGGFEIKKVRWSNFEYLVQSSYSVFSIYKRGNKGWEFFHSIHGFLEPTPHFEFDHLGNIWASHTNKGIYRLRPDNGLTEFVNVQYFGKEDGFPTERKIQVSKVDNRIIFCTRDSVYTYDDLKGAIIPYDFLNTGLGEFKASDRIVQAQNNLYWCLMDNRIALFEITAGEIRKLFNYDFSSQGTFLSSNFPHIAVLNDSIHFICLDNGFAVYNTSLNNQAPDIETVIRQIQYIDRKGDIINLIEPDPDKTYNFMFYQRNLTFEFSSNEITVSRYFKYKMEGLDEEWSDWTSNSVVNYTRLPSGEYNFMVKSRSEMGEDGSVRTVKIKIMPPWYQSKVMIVIYVLILILSAVFLRMIFMKRLAIQSEKLSLEEKEKRTRDKIMAEQSIVKLRNEKLRSELSLKSIQLANYTMTLLRKNELLIKIKEEIIKQKNELGGRYPNYYYEKIVNMIDSNISTEDDWKVFEIHFDQAHENFFKRLKEDFPELTPSDLKLCAYLRLNLTTKEIAPLLNISVRGVEIRRYRLRKRLNLPTEENLIEFLIAF